MYGLWRKGVAAMRKGGVTKMKRCKAPARSLVIPTRWVGK
ncbi:hypothetical protein A2U01_0108378, partial [Trifolium medium]|nr:hypothetical protein [Trifolium medium]